MNRACGALAISQAGSAAMEWRGNEYVSPGVVTAVKTTARHLDLVFSFSV
ncbi:hypothetical protein [Shewanella sp.]